MTLIIQGVTLDWWNPGQTPRSYLAKIILLYVCQQPCRLEFITDQGEWSQTHQFVNAAGTTVTRKAGESAGGLLTWWVKFRQQNPDHRFWKYFLVWGQPSA